MRARAVGQHNGVLDSLHSAAGFFLVTQPAVDITSGNGLAPAGCKGHIQSEGKIGAAAFGDDVTLGSNLIANVRAIPDSIVVAPIAWAVAREILLVPASAVPSASLQRMHTVTLSSHKSALFLFGSHLPMTRTLTRTNFHSSQLIRTLADLAVLETGGPAVAFAEKLGLWIDFADAIALSGVHGASTASPPVARTVLAAPLAEEFARTRASLENTIAKTSAPTAGRTRAELTMPKLEEPIDDAKAYAPFRRYHQAHQRDMESSVRTLRAKVRDGVAKASPSLKQLAALDAAFDGILCEREAKLLSSIPALLEKRFNHLRKAHLQTRLDHQPIDGPDLWMKPGAWLARFCGELQAVLLAELDLRLQPAVGLLEAFQNEKTQTV